jgi:hypothetical protein
MLFIVVCAFWQCKDKYVSPYKTPNVGYLVVEGFIRRPFGSRRWRRPAAALRVGVLRVA